MLPDQFAFMIRTPNQASAHAGAGGFADATDNVQCIPHRHRHVAQPAFMADAANWATFGDAQKLFFGPVEQGHRKNWNLTPITQDRTCTVTYQSRPAALPRSKIPVKRARSRCAS